MAEEAKTDKPLFPNHHGFDDADGFHAFGMTDDGDLELWRGDQQHGYYIPADVADKVVAAYVKRHGFEACAFCGQLKRLVVKAMGSKGGSKGGGMCADCAADIERQIGGGLTLTREGEKGGEPEPAPVVRCRWNERDPSRCEFGAPADGVEYCTREGGPDFCELDTK